MGNTGIEGQLIGRIETHDMAISIIGGRMIAKECLQLSHQIPLTGFLLAASLVTNDTTERLGSLGIVGGVEIIVGERIIPIGSGTIVNGVASLAADDIFGLIEPVLFGIAAHKPSIGNTINGGLGGIESRHIRKGGGSLIETAFLKL